MSALLGNSYCSEEHRRLEAEQSEDDAAKMTMQRLLEAVVRHSPALNPQKRAMHYETNQSFSASADSFSLFGDERALSHIGRIS